MMPHRGVLDLLDRADFMLGEIDFHITSRPDDSKAHRAAMRENARRIQNARLTLQEARRMLERTGQETRT